MPPVTIYTKPHCVQCDAAKRALDKAGITSTAVDISADPAAHSYITSLGYLQAPVLVTPLGHWSGFRPDRIKALAV